MTIDTGENVGAWRTTSDTNVIELKDDRGRLFPQGELGRHQRRPPAAAVDRRRHARRSSASG